MFAGVLIVYIVGITVFQYIEFNNTAKAIGGLPWQDGGRITMVKFCVLDTPMPYPTTCEISCPFVTSSYGTGCIAYNEILVQAQKGTQYIAAPKAFVYSGGGSFPASGMDFVAGGSTNAMPWVIGIPGLALNNAQKIKNWFNTYIIAGFKD